MSLHHSDAAGVGPSAIPAFLPHLLRDLDGYLNPSATEGVAFVFGFAEDCDDDVWQTARVSPSYVLRNQHKAILIWPLKEPATADEAGPLAAALDMQSLDEPIPTPAVEGWTLIYASDDTHTLADLNAAYLEPGTQTYGDALCLTPYDEQDYLQEMVVMLGPNSNSKNWKRQPGSIAAFVANICKKHKVGEKDGPSFVLADMHPGQRLKNAVKDCTGIGLDIDTGTPSAVIDAALVELGCLAIRYTTHSHNKTKSEFHKDKVAKFIAKAAPDQVLDDELLHRFLAEVEHWDPALISTAEYIGTDHTDRGIVHVVKHDPMPKHRVIVPLLKPYHMDDEGVTQAEAMKKWAKVPEKLAERLGVPFDRSCIDPSRLFYFPRHAKSRKFEISLFGGALFDWHSLELSNALEDRIDAETSDNKTSKSVTPEARELGRWSVTHALGFQIADVITDHCPENIRHGSGDKFEVTCPFDSDHSNAGDPEDRACFVQNAATGQSEIFTISCRHESCRDKTNLDMLGKMVKDAWFDRAVLDDENYNAVIVEDPSKPKSELTQKIEKEDKAKLDWRAVVEALNQNSTDEEIEAAINTVLDARLNDMNFTTAQDLMKKTLKRSTGAVRKGFKAAKVKRKEDKPSTAVVPTDITEKTLKGIKLSQAERDKPTYVNCLVRLAKSGIEFSYDVFNQRRLIVTGISSLTAHGAELVDEHVRCLRTYFIATEGITFSFTDIYDACMTLCEMNTFDPLLDYLDGLKWDGIPRVGNWLTMYCQTPSTPYTRAAGKIFLIGSARRAKHPGTKFDPMLICEGPPGSGKSSALAALFGEFHSDTPLGDVESKEAPEKFPGIWCLEIGELAALIRQQNAGMKTFLSMTADRYRAPYARAPKTHQRRIVFCGNTNEEGYLTDPTGNRRYIPVKTGSVIDLKGLRADRDQIWAEAVHLEAQGESDVLPEELWAVAAGEQEERLIEDPWRGALVTYLDSLIKAARNDYDRLCVKGLRVSSQDLLSLGLELPTSLQNTNAGKKLRSAMQSIPGWEYGRNTRIGARNVTGYTLSPELAKAQADAQQVQEEADKMQQDADAKAAREKAALRQGKSSKL